MHIDKWVRVGVVATILGMSFSGWSAFRADFPKEPRGTTSTATNDRSGVPVSDPTYTHIWVAMAPSIGATCFLAIALIIAAKKRDKDKPLVSLALPDTPLAKATRATFNSLSLSQRLLVKYIYEHPNTETAFLLPALSDMGFPPRVGSDALNKALTTNLVSRSNLHAFPNPEVRQIVEILLHIEPWPTPEALRSITREVIGAVQIDSNHSYNAELTKILAEGDKKYHDEQQAHQSTRAELREVLIARDKAIEGVGKMAAERNAALADLAICRKELDGEHVLANVARNNSTEDRAEIQTLKAVIGEHRQHVDAPRVVPIRYGKHAESKQNEQGIVLVNDGKEVAYEVSLQPFALSGTDGNWMISFCVIARLAKDEERLAIVQVSGKNTAIDLTWPWNQWMKSRVKRDPQTSQPINPPPVGFDVVYRDHSSNWYRSRCELWQDVANYKDELEVRFIIREKISPPVASSASEAP